MAEMIADDVPAVAIIAMGGFEIYRAGQALRFPGKTPHKPLDLLKGLLVAGGRGVSRRVLCDALWPDLDAWLSRQALHSAAFRLRRILGRKDIVRVDGEMLSLDPAQCRVDAWEFENSVGQPATREVAYGTLLRYRGPFLGDSEHPLAFDVRDRLRRKYLRAVLQLGNAYQQAGMQERAVDLYYSAVDAGCDVEEIRRSLVECQPLDSEAAR